jgi:hypothetical protein
MDKRKNFWWAVSMKNKLIIRSVFNVEFERLDESHYISGDHSSLKLARKVARFVMKNNPSEFIGYKIIKEVWEKQTEVVYGKGS